MRSAGLQRQVIMLLAVAALGDGLVTAEIFASLLPRLADQGITTLGHATAFTRRAKGLIQAQAKAGW